LSRVRDDEIVEALTYANTPTISPFAFISGVESGVRLKPDRVLI